MKSLSDYRPYDTLYVDGMNLLSRSYHGLSMLEYKGKKTGMLTGVARLVVDWQKSNGGIRIVFVWEGLDSWRKAKFPIYKAHRRADPPEERDQFFTCIEQVRESLPAMGVDQVSAYTYEADDTVWTVSEGDSGKIAFWSTDWDWWPLSHRGDIVYQNAVMTPRALADKFSKKFNCDSIPMDRMWLFKTLTGDSSDGVSGIPRFPKKVAAELANDPGVGPDDIVHGLITHGYSKLAAKVADHLWIVTRNIELVSAKPPAENELEWVEGCYDVDRFGDILLKSGMGNLHDKLTGGVGGE